VKSIAVKFLLLLVFLSLAFIALSTYYSYRSAKGHTDKLIEQQADLAMQYNLAIRQYVAEVIRPFLDKNLADCDFAPEVMSSSYISRRVFEQVRRSFPDLILKFSSATPRNPLNQADLDEQRILQYFNEHPQQDTFSGEIDMSGKRYYGIFTARRVQSECLHCHGAPDNAPKTIIDIYGPRAGFHHQKGEIIALDAVAVPKDRIESAIYAELQRHVTFLLLGILLAVALLYYLFRRLISRPISKLAGHFDHLSSAEGQIIALPLKVDSRDEIGTLTRSFNKLTQRLQHYQTQLEQQVEKRTAELERANRELSQEIAERRAAEESRRLNEKRLEAMLQLSQMGESDPNEISDFALTAAVKLTGSEAGYLIVLDEEVRIESVFGKTLAGATACRLPALRRISDNPFLVRLVHEAIPSFCNTPQACEDSIFDRLLICPTPIRRHLNLPILQGNRIVAVAGAANKNNEYDGADLRQMTLLFEGLWHLLHLKRAEHEKEQLSEQLQQARKMEAIGRLAGGIAHDFNNILTGISGYADLLTMQGAGETSLEIKKAAERASRLTSQLLTFSRRQTVAPRLIELNRLLDESLPALRQEVCRDIEVHLTSCSQSCPVRIDPDQFNQILFNLTANAAEAMPDGGQLTLETKCIRLPRALLAKFPQTRSGIFVELQVRDTGTGIDPTIIDKIFEPFFTTKEFGRNAGFGLATVYGIVEQNKGAVEVESQVGQGTVFHIYLPLWTGKGPGLETALPETGETPGRKTVLIVDDHAIIVNLTKRVLTDQGYQVITAPDSVQALERYDRERPAIDLLVTDVTMPVMDGVELHRRLSKKIPALRVLFMSGFSADYLNRPGFSGEGKYFVQKPFSIDDFSRKVREALGAPASSTDDATPTFTILAKGSSALN